MAGFCDDSQSQQSSQGWQDPLGPTSISKSGQPSFSATGAPQLRGSLFNYLGNYIPGLAQSGQETASALKAAAANPTWAQAEGNASKNAAGDYLNGSPQLNEALARQRAQSLTDVANQNARTRSQFSKNGMQFSTGNQQAQQAATGASNAASDNTAAQTYLQNYQNERANQNNAATQLQGAYAAPLNYLTSVPGAQTAPLSSAGNILSALSGGGQVFNTGQTGSYSPSLGSSIMNGFSGVMGSL